MNKIRRGGMEQIKLSKKEYIAMNKLVGGKQPPCVDCVGSFNFCRDTGKDCKAFRTYVANNSFRYRDIGKNKEGWETREPLKYLLGEWV